MCLHAAMCCKTGSTLETVGQPADGIHLVWSGERILCFSWCIWNWGTDEGQLAGCCCVWTRLKQWWLSRCEDFCTLSVCVHWVCSSRSHHSRRLKFMAAIRESSKQLPPRRCSFVCGCRQEIALVSFEHNPYCCCPCFCHSDFVRAAPSAWGHMSSFLKVRQEGKRACSKTLLNKHVEDMFGHRPCVSPQVGSRLA